MHFMIVAVGSHGGFQPYFPLEINLEETMYCLKIVREVLRV